MRISVTGLWTFLTIVETARYHASAFWIPSSSPSSSAISPIHSPLLSSLSRPPTSSSSSRPFVLLRVSDNDVDDAFASFAASLHDKEDDGQASASDSLESEEEKNPSANENNREKNEGQDSTTKTWQEDLDELLDPVTTLSRRQELFQTLMAENADIRASVQAAIRDRKIDPLLTPTGKKIQDGTRAVARQLTTDILPSLASTARSSSSPFPLPLPPPPPPLPPVDQVSKVGTRLLTALQNQLQNGLQTLQEDMQDPVNNIPSRVAQQGQVVLDTAANLVKETPENWPEPEYTVVDTTDEYEIRDYVGYTAACTNILQPEYEYDSTSTAAATDQGNDDDSSSASSSSLSSFYSLDTRIGPTGAAFNSLVAYLLGANQQQQMLEMTTPVTTTMTGEMRFYLVPPKNTKSKSSSSSSKETDIFPDPLKQDESKNAYQQGVIRLQEIPPARLAVRRFTGFCTRGEMARQKEALLTALAADSDRYELDVAHGQTVGHVLFQYNPPYITIPVLRRNEIAVPILVTPEEEEDEKKEKNGSSKPKAAPVVVNGASLVDSWVSPSAMDSNVV